MAEKPRLKETDEIFSSIGRGATKTPPLPVTSQAPPKASARAQEQEQEPGGSLIESLLQDSDQQPAPRQNRRPSGSSKRTRRQKQEEQDKDPSPLDFNKYKLPSKGERKSSDPLSETAPEKAVVPTTEQLISALPKIRRITPPSSEKKEEGEPLSFSVANTPPPPAPQPQVQPFIFPDLEQETVSNAPPSLGPIPSDTSSAIQADLPKATPPAQQKNAEEKQSPKDLPKPDDLFRQLSNRFDEAFSQAFERKGKDLPKQPSQKGVQNTGQEKPMGEKRLPPPLEEDLHAQRETDSFLQEFRTQVQEEEEVRTELFKDTLAEKFERERERYLKELGISPPADQQEPAPGFQPPAVRKLDLQIDPQMHMQPGKSPKPSRAGSVGEPVTYSPTGTLRPLGRQSEEEMFPPPPAQSPAPQTSSERRSTEELLLELGRKRQTSGRPSPRPVEAEVPKGQSHPMAAAIPSRQEDKPKKNSNPKIIALSVVVAMALLLVFLVPFALNRLLAVAQPDESSSAFVPNEGGRDLLIYENRSPAQQEQWDNLLIKKSNVKVQNFAVRDNLLIQNIESEGTVHLEDISVGGELRLGVGSVDRLVLRNVSANRLVINNSQAVVKVELEGQGTIDTMEIRTPAVLDRTLSQGADGTRVQQVILRAAPEVGVLDVTLGGLEIRSLSAQLGTVLKLGKDTVVEQLTGEGTLSLSGEGQVLNMVIQPSDLSESSVLHLGARVGSLLIKGQSQMTVDALVSSLNLSEDTTLSGQGEISYMILSPPVNWHRLQLKVDGVNIHNLIADADSTLQVTGSGRVMELRANASVYALGNKVNVLYTNADGVIYEEEPDRLVTTAGIHPPGSVADHPNLDYFATSLSGSQEVDTALDDVSTVCGHSRESGGFLKGDGSVDSPYLVETPAQLAHLSKHLDSHFYQIGDIDIADDPRFVSGFPVIGEQAPFTGSYDGGGYGIYHLRIQSSAEHVGLFGINEGRLQNIFLRSGEVRSTATTRSYVGGIVGRNRPGGTVAACSNGARVTGGANSYLGGICGYNEGAKIRDCYNAAKILGSPLGGGLVGVNGKDASLAGSYNVGTIEDGSAVAGQNVDGGIITNCYYLSETAGTGIGTGTGSAVERSSDEMSSHQMVADLDAGRDTSPWEKSSGTYTYPLLKAPELPEFLEEGDHPATP
jgi:hypothetical protein